MINIKKMNNIKRYLIFLKNELNLNENELKKKFMDAISIDLNQVGKNQKEEELIKEFYKKTYEKISEMMFYKFLKNKKYNIEKIKINISFNNKTVSFPLKECLEFIIKDLKNFSYQNRDLLNPSHMKNKSIQHILNDTIEYSHYNFSKNEVNLGEILGLILIKNKVSELLKYKKIIPFKNLEEYRNINNNYKGDQRKTSNYFINNNKIYIYGWTLEALNKYYLSINKNFKSVKPINFKEWYNNERLGNIKFPSKDIIIETKKNKINKSDILILENKNYFVKDNIRIIFKRGINKYLNSMNLTNEYDELRGTKSYYYISLFKDNEIISFLIPHKKYQNFINCMKKRYNKNNSQEYFKIFNKCKIKCIEERNQNKIKINERSMSIYVKFEDFCNIFNQYKYINYKEENLNIKEENIII